MLEDLDQLANRVRQLAQLAQDLRNENRSLQGELTRRDAHIRSLNGTLAAAQSRVDAVLARLPVPPSQAEEPEEAQAEDDPLDLASVPSSDRNRSLHGTS